MSDDKNEQRAFDIKVKQLEMIVSERKLELGFFWQRSLFFWGFIASAFLAYSSLKDDLLARLIVTCFGTICSLTWTLANRGSKYWYESWEQKSSLPQFSEIEGGLYLLNMPTQEPELALSARRYSVTRLAIGLSDFTFLIWVIFLVVVATKQDWQPTNWGALSSLWLTAAYTVVLIWRGRFSGKGNSN